MATYTIRTAEQQDVLDKNRLNALAPYDGYLAYIGAKTDALVFKEDVGFINSVADKNRYIKVNGEAIDTFLHENYDESEGGVVGQTTNFETYVQDQATNGLVTQQACNEGDWLVVDRENVVVNGTFDSDISGWSDGEFDNGRLKFTGLQWGSATQTITGLIIGQTYVVSGDVEGDGIDAYIHIDQGTDVTIGYNVANGTYAGKFVADQTSVVIRLELHADGSAWFDNISLKQLDEQYHCIQDAPIGTSLTDTAYFTPKDGDKIGTYKLLAHQVDSTGTYNGIVEKPMVNGVIINDPKATMLLNGYSLTSGGSYSKDGNYYLPVAVVWQRNDKAYHPIFNENGVKAWAKSGSGGDKDWYDSDIVSYVDSVYKCFIAYGDSPDGIGVWGASGSRPDDLSATTIYPQDAIDMREWAFIPDETLKEQIKKDKALDGQEFGVKTILATTSYISASPSATVDIALSDIEVGTKLLIEQTSVPFKLVEIVSYNGFNEYTLSESVERDVYYDVYLLLDSNHLTNGNSLTTDVIGDPATYPQIVKDRLSEGKPCFFNPLLISDEGDSLLPVDTNSFKVGKKAILWHNSVWNNAGVLESSTKLNDIVANLKKDETVAEKEIQYNVNKVLDSLNMEVEKIKMDEKMKANAQKQNTVQTSNKTKGK